MDQVEARRDTQSTFREAPRCGGGAPEGAIGGPDAAGPTDISHAALSRETQAGPGGGLA